MADAPPQTVAETIPTHGETANADSVLLGYIGRGLMMFSLLVVLVIARWHLPLGQDGLALMVAVLFALPGWAIALTVGGRASARRPEFWLWGTVVGWGITSFIALIVGYIVGEFVWLPVWICTGLSLLAIFVLRGRQQVGFLDTIPRFSVAEHAIAWGGVALSVFFVLEPYTNLGILTPNGHAYPWLFGFDFINRVSIAANGAVALPPDFFHIAGEKLHYYMITYIYPIAVKKLIGPHAEMLAIMIVWQLLLQVVFVLTLLSVLRLLARRPLVFLAAVLSALAFYSYYWIYVAARSYALAHPDSWLATGLGFDWAAYSYVSHLLYRYFLVEPQTVLGFLMVLVIVGGLIVARGRLTMTGAVGIGFLLGVLFGTDGLMALWLLGAAGVYVIVGGLAAKENRTDWFARWALAGIVFAATAGSYFLVRMYVTGGASTMVIAAHPIYLRALPAYLLIEFGPLLICGLIGGWRLRAAGTAAFAAWWLAMLAALTAIASLQSQFDDQLGLLKGTRFALLLLILASPACWELILDRRAGARRSVPVTVALLTLIAVPTWFTDRTRTADWEDTTETVFVTPEDHSACRWIRHNLPDDAVVQSAPSYVNYRITDRAVPYAYPLIANFAERPMVIGAWGMPQNLPNILKRFYRLNDNIKEMFALTTADSLASVAASYGIDYLYVGPWERTLYPTLGAVAASRPDLLETVYDVDDIRIYRVRN